MTWCGHTRNSGHAMHLIGGKELRMARAARGHHEMTSEEIRLARRMAHEGRRLQEIHEALGWDCHPNVTRRRLKKMNIRPYAKRAHRGHTMSLPPGHGVNQGNYRPAITGDESSLPPSAATSSSLTPSGGTGGRPRVGPSARVPAASSIPKLVHGEAPHGHSRPSLCCSQLARRLGKESRAPLQRTVTP